MSTSGVCRFFIFLYLAALILIPASSGTPIKTALFILAFLSLLAAVYKKTT